MSVAPRHLRYIRVSPAWYIQLLKGRETRRCRPAAHVLPDDCSFVDGKITERGDLILIVESASFAAVEPDQLVPEHPTTQMEVVTYATDLREVRGHSINENEFGQILNDFENQVDAFAIETELNGGTTARALREYLDRLRALVPVQ